MDCCVRSSVTSKFCGSGDGARSSNEMGFLCDKSMSSQSSSSSSVLSGVTPFGWGLSDEDSLESSSVSSLLNIMRASSCSFSDGFLIGAVFFGAARLDLVPFDVFVGGAKGGVGDRTVDGGSERDEESERISKRSSIDVPKVVLLFRGVGFLAAPVSLTSSFVV